MTFELSSLTVIFETSGSCFDAVTNNKNSCNLDSEHFCKKRLRNSLFSSETSLSNLSTSILLQMSISLLSQITRRIDLDFFPADPKLQELGRTKSFAFREHRTQLGSVISNSLWISENKEKIRYHSEFLK